MIRRLVLLCILLLGPTPLPAAVTLSEDTLVRDAEIEDTLKSYINPIFESAGLDPKSLHLYVIGSKVVNAMAMGGGQIGINIGLILRAESALQVIGVLAHETAHLADHHVVRGGDAYAKALIQNLLVTLGGIAAGVASGRPDLGMAIAAGSGELAMRGLLKFNRTQEGSADQGAVRFLEKLHWSSRGMLEFMGLLHKDTFISTQHIDPYVQTHPLTSERVAFFRSHVEKSAYSDAPLPEPLEKNFQRLKVKIAAFTDSPGKTLSHFQPTDTSLLARYARAIAYFQAAREKEALEEMDSLLHDFPQDPFFWDLKGQILFEAGKISEAMTAYEKATMLRPDIPLFHLSHAHALLESGNDATLEKAYSELLRVQVDEPNNPFTYQLLAICYGKQGKTGLSALSIAEMGLLLGDLEKAEQQAKRALHLLKSDTKNTERANDILEEVERLKSRERFI